MPSSLRTYLKDIKKIPLSEVFQMIEKGKIIDGKTITSLLYLMYLDILTKNKLKAQD